MLKESRWHEMAKEVLKEIGESRGYDVSKSEKTMILALEFKMYRDEKREIHTLSYKPDVVWKKGHTYRAIFEVEYLNLREDLQSIDKRKYSIGSLMLAYAAMLQKSIRRLVFVTNSKDLCSEIASFINLAQPLKYSTEKICWVYNPTTNRQALMMHLRKWTVDRWKL